MSSFLSRAVLAGAAVTLLASDAWGRGASFAFDGPEPSASNHLISHLWNRTTAPADRQEDHGDLKECFMKGPASLAWSVVLPRKAPFRSLYIGAHVDQSVGETQICSGQVLELDTIGFVFATWTSRGQPGQYSLQADDVEFLRARGGDDSFPIMEAFGQICDALMKREQPDARARDTLARYYVGRQNKLYKKVP